MLVCNDGNGVNYYYYYSNLSPLTVMVMVGSDSHPPSHINHIMPVLI